MNICQITLSCGYCTQLAATWNKQMNVTENALDQSRAHSTNHTNIGSRGSARWLPAAGGAEDRINIELVSSSEHRLPKKEPSSTSIGTCVREEAEDRINILEFERERQAQRAATPATHLLDAENAQPAVTLEELKEDPQYRCVRAQIDPPHQNQCCRSCQNCFTTSHNSKLQRAYDTGWAMLMSSVFPLVPNHAYITLLLGSMPACICHSTYWIVITTTHLSGIYFNCTGFYVIIALTSLL